MPLIGVKLHAVAARRLGGIQGLAGAAQGIRKDIATGAPTGAPAGDLSRGVLGRRIPGQGRGNPGDPDADRPGQGGLAVDGGGAHRAAQALGAGGRVHQVGIRQHHGEGPPAHAAGDLALPQPSPQQPAELVQGPVPGLRAQGLVEGPEMVDVDEQQGHRLARLPPPPHLAPRHIQEVAAVGQAGQGVMGRHVVKPRGGRLQPADQGPEDEQRLRQQGGQQDGQHPLLRPAQPVDPLRRLHLELAHGLVQQGDDDVAGLGADVGEGSGAQFHAGIRRPLVPSKDAYGEDQVAGAPVQVGRRRKVEGAGGVRQAMGDAQVAVSGQQRTMGPFHCGRGLQQGCPRPLVMIFIEVARQQADALRQHALAARDIDDGAAVALLGDDVVQQQVHRPRQQGDQGQGYDIGHRQAAGREAVVGTRHVTGAVLCETDGPDRGATAARSSTGRCRVTRAAGLT
ncbi:hypothetical protein ULB03_18845 [Nitrospirillum sp. BR 11828]|nr:hypothetical protein [Nitrospirillum sp. BR 11828]MDZ5649172.1 hypothetical protein [Nitrospirillum sp. BR 11828]